MTLKRGTTLKDEHIVNLAFVAHKAMKDQNVEDTKPDAPGTKSFKNDLGRGGGPTVMTVVVQGEHVIFASSMKGKGLIYDDKISKIVVPKTQQTEKYWQNLKSGVCPLAIEKGLKECGFLVEGTTSLVGHQNGGSCGEIMAAWALCDLLPNAELGPSRVVAVERVNGDMVIKDPCGAAVGDDSVSAYALAHIDNYR
jgi:hypothetical protein